ncbi:unnamed protein product [Phyllotreta striolata]|uniref:threonine--tRNA ligase n=1 Tax=Phyllotreta striolata TaxID=444603 RepID=A0A9N9XJX7_PHYSR|nr:unnamed protein product [Phyllotreta striolata]
MLRSLIVFSLVINLGCSLICWNCDTIQSPEGCKDPFNITQVYEERMNRLQKYDYGFPKTLQCQNDGSRAEKMVCLKFIYKTVDTNKIVIERKCQLVPKDLSEGECPEKLLSDSSRAVDFCGTCDGDECNSVKLAQTRSIHNGKSNPKLEDDSKPDHRKIGRDQELYFFNEMSPGSCFFQPRGAHIYNTLVNFIKQQYKERGYKEVITPNIYNVKLWKKSGHWSHYAENMFAFDIENDKYALKPMNCPGHCLIFDNRFRSWRELPLRLADFGVLHRNELSGVLTGLTRVRRFQQDDAHIFCTPDQLSREISDCLEFIKYVYSTFGFTFDLCLSTRPEKCMGDMELWNSAEKSLEDSLNSFGHPWKLNPGDGAFYGPKIDITIKDALQRDHQCATIQLDFQLPLRFNLSYSSNNGEKKQPVMIHRAILGSVERFIAVLAESYAGKWPFWLSPRQAMIVPVKATCDEYAEDIRRKLLTAGFMAEVDKDPGKTLGKKIKTAQLAQFNFILVVGEKEQLNNAVNVRSRSNTVLGEHSIESIIGRFTKLRDNYVLNEGEF